MAAGTVANLDFRLVQYVKSFNWSSTSNPYSETSWDVSLSGYKPIAVGYAVNGKGGTTVIVSVCRTAGDRVFFSARSMSTPGSVSQNSVTFNVLYVPEKYVSQTT